MTTSIGYRWASARASTSSRWSQISPPPPRRRRRRRSPSARPPTQAKVSGSPRSASGIDSFASALSSLISGGTLFSQPSVSDPSVFTATAIPGARLGGLSASIEVDAARPGADRVSDALRAAAPTRSAQGDLTLTTAAGSVDVVDHRRQRQSRRPRQGDQRQAMPASPPASSPTFERRAAGAEGRDRRGQRLHPVASRTAPTSGLERFASARRRRHDRGAGGAGRGVDARRRDGRAARPTASAT